MKRYLLAIVIFSLCMMIGSVSEAKPLKVFILAGQSNMVGQAKSSELPKDMQNPQKDVLIFDGKEWIPLAPAQPLYGPEMSFGKRMAEKLNEPIGIIKHAVNGTNLARQWNPKDPKSLYSQLIAKVKLAEKAKDIEIVGMLWMQGESDAMNQQMAKDYADNLSNFIQAARKDLDSKKMIFIAGRINPLVQRFTFVDVVRKAQENCKVSDYGFVSCDDLSKAKDNLHYDAKGNIDLGNAFADSMLKLMKKSPGGK